MRFRPILLALMPLLPGAAQGWQAHLEAARAAEVAGRFPEAERHYEQALAERPDPEIYQRLGLVRHLQNKFAEALPAFEKALAGDPKLWGSHLFLGIGFYRGNHFEKALAHLKSAEQLQPGHHEILLWRGATHLALKQYFDGFDALERSLERDPSNAQVLRLLAQHYADYGVELWNGVAERHFETSAGQEVHGHALEFEGSHDAAVAAYRQALTLDPNRPGLRLALGRALLIQGKGNEALPELEAELRLQPGHPEAAYHLGLALLSEKRFEEAVSHLVEADRWADSADAPLALAKAYLTLGRQPEAVKSIQRAVALSPLSEEARELHSLTGTRP